jgi:predicted DNA-binding transcriptional regulator YafY
VEHVYWSGSTSLQKLSATLAGLPGISDTSATVVEQDIALLRRHGLPMSVDEAGRWRIDAVIPGFALRLTKAEASIVWAWCVARRSSDRPVAPCVSPGQLSAAVATLLSGLRQFHVGSEVMNAADGTTTRPEVVAAGEPERRLQASELIGGARLVYRRLRIVDLIEGRKAVNTSQLAAVLDVSQRTVHDDLNVLRCSGLEIRFCRRCQEFQTKGLNSYLAGRLTLPTAAALLVLFTSTDGPHRSPHGAVAFGVASEKLAKSIRLIFARQAEDLQELAVSYGASEPAK